MRLGPPPEVEEAPGQFWKDFIRETAPVFRKPTIEQLDDVHRADLAGALRRRALRRRAPARDLRRAAAGRDRRGQRRRASRRSTRRGRPWVRIVSCNPLELQDPAIPPVFSGYPAGDRSGWDAFRAEYRRAHADLHASSSTRSAASAARRPLPEARVHPRVAVAQPLPLPGRGRLRARAAARRRPGTGSSPRVRDDRRRLRAARAARRRRRARSSTSRLGSLGSADVELMQRLVDVLAAIAAPRSSSPRARSTSELELADNMCGRRVPAAAVDPAAGRPRHHARRQQHDDRVPPLRQADGRAAAVLGPVRQRPAGRRDRLRRPPAHRTRSRTDELLGAIDALARRPALCGSARGNLGQDRARTRHGEPPT